MPSQHWAAIVRSENGHLIKIAYIHVHCVENFEDLFNDM